MPKISAEYAAKAIKDAFAAYDKSDWGYNRNDIRGPFVEYLVTELLPVPERDKALDLLEDLPT